MTAFTVADDGKSPLEEAAAAIRSSFSSPEVDLAVRSVDRSEIPGLYRVQLEDGPVVYATADGNYTTVFYWRDGQVQKRLLRLSLKNVAQQLADFEDIIRCHRSYVVNKRQIEDISGNARSLNLRMADGTASIPVSRTFPREDLL